MVKNSKEAFKEIFNEFQKKYERLGYTVEKNIPSNYFVSAEDAHGYLGRLNSISLINEELNDRVIMSNIGCHYGERKSLSYFRFVVGHHNLDDDKLVSEKPITFYSDYSNIDVRIEEDEEVRAYITGASPKGEWISINDWWITLDSKEAEEIFNLKEKRISINYTETPFRKVSNPSKIADIVKKKPGRSYVEGDRIIGIRKRNLSGWGRKDLYEVAHYNLRKNKIICTTIGEVLLNPFK